MTRDEIRQVEILAIVVLLAVLISWLVPVSF